MWLSLMKYRCYVTNFAALRGREHYWECEAKKFMFAAVPRQSILSKR